MNRIQRVSQFSKLCFGLLFFLLPAVSVFLWFGIMPDYISPTLYAAQHHDLFADVLSYHALQPFSTAYTITSSTRVWAFLSVSLTTSLEMLSLYFLIQLFHCYEKQQVFSQPAAVYLKKAAYALLGAQLTAPLVSMLLSHILTYNNPAGQHFVSVGFDGHNIRSILVAALFSLIAWIMTEKHRDKGELNM